MTRLSSSTSSPSPNGRRLALLGGLGALAFAALQLTPGAAAEQAIKIPPPATTTPAAGAAPRETVVFAGGCFWGVQGVFQHTRGVVSAISGYAGGKRETASYEKVSSGSTGHAEAVQVTFDPKQVSYGQLMQIYFSVVHDPTQLDRQGPDSGSQYRSAVFYANDAQKQATERYIAQLDAAKVYPARIVTRVSPLEAFYPAEDYHQDYATVHPESPYIAHFDLPKIENLKRLFPEAYRPQPVLVKMQ
jgi:peptide-methionine (S)-S-oxide reductase